ncbi:MAG: fibrobacter succinogenes major paralogous domain-containing protein [Flavobacteriales bacterium]|jgi:uncharacterized protein (TIGR02145 family)|nr:fibrobacter succinogenes major paralogous domain-containing protein [Flavobacteriales bacterium]
MKQIILISFLCTLTVFSGCEKEDCSGCQEVSTVTDSDGNFYNTISIGQQCWFVQNLKTTSYRNGDAIATGLLDTEWANATSGAYAYYDNDPSNNENYGKLYNWHAINDSRGLCPDGWHVPSDDDWKVLERTLGASASDVAATGWRGTNQGGEMKSTSSLWQAPNSGANNSSGFSALPAGNRTVTGSFTYSEFHAYFWSSTQENTTDAWARTLYNDNEKVYRSSSFFKTYGLSCRCVRD